MQRTPILTVDYFFSTTRKLYSTRGKAQSTPFGTAIAKVRDRRNSQNH
jgi:hypothetical protein